MLTKKEAKHLRGLESEYRIMMKEIAKHESEITSIKADMTPIAKEITQLRAKADDEA